MGPVASRFAVLAWESRQRVIRKVRSMQKLRIAIATSGRFHVLDLARELDALRHDVRFYSYVPSSRAAQFGLPARCHFGYLPLVAPVLAWDRFARGVTGESWSRMFNAAFNHGVIARLQPCDVFIGMSGTFVEAPLYARRRYGAKIIVERGSQHVLSQREILAATPGACAPTDYAVERELKCYEFADFISVPSHQVVDSFKRDPQVAAKLLVNPYGVDLQQFPLRLSRKPDVKTVLFAGNWIYRKGVDVLTEAIEQMPDVRLLHVGSLGDAPFPSHPRITHHEPVPQWQLSEFYAKAHAFVMASREEGLALVQAQALASGLPLVCTDRTGGADLAHSAALAARIRVVPSNDAPALKQAMTEVLDKALANPGFGPLPEADRQTLSWQAYGQRYASNLATLFENKPGVRAL